MQVGRTERGMVVRRLNVKQSALDEGQLLREYGRGDG